MFRTGQASPIQSPSSGTPYGRASSPQAARPSEIPGYQYVPGPAVGTRYSGPMRGGQNVFGGTGAVRNGVVQAQSGTLVREAPSVPTLHGGESPNAEYYYNKERMRERWNRIPQGWQKAFPDIAAQMKLTPGEQWSEEDHLRRLEAALAPKRRQYTDEMRAYQASIRPWMPKVGRPGGGAAGGPPRDPVTGNPIPKPAMPATLLDNPFRRMQYTEGGMLGVMGRPEYRVR